MKDSLHITNGDCITNRLIDLAIDGDFVIWREMLCEGPTEYSLATESAISKRQDFLHSYYESPDKDFYVEKFISQLNKINSNIYQEIILWFEYDLFCHVNLCAAISYLKQQNITTPLYLVCSGHIENNEKLKGLAELSTPLLLEHYTEKIKLNSEDCKIADTFWKTYCSTDHISLKKLIGITSSFKYLSDCIIAHFNRFPDPKTQLNLLEHSVLKAIDKHSFSSLHQLIRYLLNNQEYYGFGDLQIIRIIDRMHVFYSITEHTISLNKKGKDLLYTSINSMKNNMDSMVFGGIAKHQYTYNKNTHSLIHI